MLFFLSDIIGHNWANPQLLADAFAAHGYHVVVPDLFRGNPYPLGGAGRDFDDWFRGHQPAAVQPVVDRVLAAIQALRPSTIAAVGYAPPRAPPAPR